MLLTQHQQLIESACETIRECACVNRKILVERVLSLEQAMLDHLDVEEDVILQPYAICAPHDAASILAANGDLRRQLFQVSLDAQLDRIRAPALEQLAASLRSHLSPKDRNMYVWAQSSLPLKIKRELWLLALRSVGSLTVRV